MSDSKVPFLVYGFRLRKQARAINKQQCNLSRVRPQIQKTSARNKHALLIQIQTQKTKREKKQATRFKSESESECTLAAPFGYNQIGAYAFGYGQSALRFRFRLRKQAREINSVWQQAAQVLESECLGHSDSEFTSAARTAGRCSRPRLVLSASTVAITCFPQADISRACFLSLNVSALWPPKIWNALSSGKQIQERLSKLYYLRASQLRFTVHSIHKCDWYFAYGVIQLADHDPRVMGVMTHFTISGSALDALELCDVTAATQPLSHKVSTARDELPFEIPTIDTTITFVPPLHFFISDSQPQPNLRRCHVKKKGIGKTAILEQLIYGNVTLKSSFYSTIEDIYVANIETDRGTKERVCFYDTAGLEPPLTGPPQSPTMQLTANQVLQRHYLGFAEGFVMVYDTTKPESLDVLMYLKKDIDRNKDKKEVVMLVIGNRTGVDDVNSLENTCSKAANWCSREKVRHFEVSAMDRPSLYEPFIYLTSRLNPVQNKTAFPQLSTLSKLTQKNNKSEAM
ncbi:hypothetical protein evm_004526 [Chilo suppressalis]|nr:hypothetical protein evm_004526 [Chilo suppressalis]